MDVDTDAYCALAAAMVIRALQDVWRDQPCDYRCIYNKHHSCALSAIRFLASEGCETLLELLGLDPGELIEVLHSGRERRWRRSGRKIVERDGNDE